MKKLILLFGTTLLAATCNFANAQWMNLAEPVDGVTLTYLKGTFIFEKDRVILPVRFTELSTGRIFRYRFVVLLADCRAEKGTLVMTTMENEFISSMPFVFSANSTLDKRTWGIAGYLCIVAEHKHHDYKGEVK